MSRELQRSNIEVWSPSSSKGSRKQSRLSIENSKGLPSRSWVPACTPGPQKLKPAFESAQTPSTPCSRYQAIGTDTPGRGLCVPGGVLILELERPGRSRCVSGSLNHSAPQSPTLKTEAGGNSTEMPTASPSTYWAPGKQNQG